MTHEYHMRKNHKLEKNIKTITIVKEGDEKGII
jgi:hypothetical protein